MNQDFRFSVNTEGEKARFQLSGECTFTASVDGRSNARSGGAGDVNASLSRKARKKVVAYDEAVAVAFFLKNNMLQYLRLPMFAVNKTEAKKLLELGVVVPGLALVDCATKNDAQNPEHGR